VADLAARGLGAAILSETIAEVHRDRLRAVVIEDVETPALLALIWKPVSGSALEEFLRHCRSAFSSCW
jgi:DNA-binding transcriptional LysR family regulator